MAGGLTKRTAIACVLALVVGLVAGIGASRPTGPEIETDVALLYRSRHPQRPGDLPRAGCMRHRKVSIGSEAPAARTLAKVSRR